MISNKKPKIVNEGRSHHCGGCGKDIFIRSSQVGGFWHLSGWTNQYNVSFTGGYCSPCFTRMHTMKMAPDPAPRFEENPKTRLCRLYCGVRFEEHHNRVIACGAIFPSTEIKPDQHWQGSAGNLVTIDNVDSIWVYYHWEEGGNKIQHCKTPFAFQCRYCLAMEE
jgi:hypothetical protein